MSYQGLLAALLLSNRRECNFLFVLKVNEMKKNVLGIFLFASLLVISGGFLMTASAVEGNSFAFSPLETVIIEDSVDRSYRTDWFPIDGVQPGIMTMEVSWGNSYDIDCYISTTASTLTALSSETSADNPKSCSYEIQTAGTYYVGIVCTARGRIDTTPYTAIVTFNEGTIDPDVTDPLVTLTAPANGITVADSISITATASDSESGVDYVACTFGGASVENDYSAPYTWAFDTTSVSDGVYSIAVTAYDVAGNSATDTISVTVDNGIVVNPGDGEKIAVFFWASDAGIQANIDEYWSVLQLEGYTTKFDFRDTADFEADFNTVEAYEDPEDTIFFYFFGHGNNNGEDSLTAFAPGTSLVYSSELRVMFDRLDAERIGYLIESCHSGGFPVDFHAEPYLAMSTSDEDHNSYALATFPGEGLFSDAFFDHVMDGFSAVESFDFAEQVVFDNARNDRFAQFPMIADYSDYVWFV